MSKERYSIFSEFYNLIKISEESEDPSEEASEEEVSVKLVEPESESDLEKELADPQEEVGESTEDEPAPPEHTMTEEEKSQINPEIAKLLARRGPDTFFEQEIDKLYPDLAITALDSLFKEEGGEFEFFRLKRNGIRLYKDYPNSVKSFIIHKLSFRHYIKWGLINEFPEYLEVFKKRWRGVPQVYQEISYFIKQGLYLLNPEETISVVLEKSNNVEDYDTKQWIWYFFKDIPTSFIEENKNSFKEILENLIIKKSDSSFIEVYFSNKLYKVFPEFFEKAADTLGTWQYFSNNIPELDPDKERVRSKILKFVEDGQVHYIPEEYRTEEVIKAIALKEISNLSKVIFTKDEEIIFDEEQDEDERLDLGDIQFNLIFNYIRLINGDNFSALDDQYQDSYIDSDGTEKSFSLLISNTIDNLGEEILGQTNFLRNILTHKYSLLFKEKFEELLSRRLATYDSIEDRGRGSHRNVKVYFLDTIFNKQNKSLLEKNHNELYNSIISSIIKHQPTLWLKELSEDSPKWDNLILSSIKIKVLENKNDRRKIRDFISFIEANKEFIQRNRDAVKNLFKDIYINNTNILNNIESYFKNGSEYFPEILNEEILINNDSEEKSAVMPFEILISEKPHLFFETEEISTGEDAYGSFFFPRKDFELNLPQKYPDYIPLALRGMLLKDSEYSGTAINRRYANAVKTWVHFLINSSQISDEIRSEFMDSAEFKNYIAYSIKDNLLSFLETYPNKFKEEIEEALKKSIIEFKSKDTLNFNLKPNFADVFYADRGDARGYRDLYPDLARSGFSSILERSEENPDILSWIDDFSIYQDLFNNFIAKMDILSILDTADKSSARNYMVRGYLGRLNKAIDGSVISDKLKLSFENFFDELFDHAFSSSEKGDFLLRLIKDNKELSKLFLDNLDYSLAFAILFGKQSRSLSVITIFDRNYSVDNFPSPENINDKLIELFNSGIDISKVKQYLKRADYAFPGEAYTFVKRLKENYPNSSVSDDFKISLEKYLAKIDPVAIIKNSDSESISNLIDNVLRSSVEVKNKLEENLDGEIPWQAPSSYRPYADYQESDLYKEHKNNQKILLDILNILERSYASGYFVPDISSDKRENYILNILSLIEDPIIYFQIIDSLIYNVKMNRSNELFDLTSFENINNIKEKNLLKISKDLSSYKKLLGIRYIDELLTKEEFINVSIDIINNSNNYSDIFNLYKRESSSDIIDSSTAELKDYIIKLAVEKEDSQFLIFEKTLSRAIALGYLTIDEGIDLVVKYESDSGRYPSSGRLFNRYIQSFINDMYKYKADSVEKIIEELYKNNKYSLSSIILESINNQTFTKDVALKISKGVLLGGEESKEDDIVAALTCPGIFDDAEVLPVIRDYISTGLIMMEESGIYYKDRRLFKYEDFMVNNRKFYENNKDIFPKISVTFKTLRKLKVRDYAIDLLENLDNDNFLPRGSYKNWDEINDVIKKEKSIKINESIYQTEQRPYEWDGYTRYTLSQINLRPNDAMYDINKQLIHAGDGVNHTNVGTSGFTSAWALFSIQRDRNKSYFCIEQYQSDYPVVLGKIFNVEKNGPDWEGYESIEEYERSLESNARIKERYPNEYKDLVSHFNIITTVYPYIVLANSIKVAMASGFSHIYILKRAPELANIANEEKAEKLYVDIPLQITSESEVINDEDCWKIDATEEVYSKLMSIARELTERDSNYNFGLSPAQNSQERVRERERKMRAPWAASAEKRKRLEEINDSLRERFPEENIPDFTNPTDLLRFLNTEIRPLVSKKQFNREFSPLIRELSILKRSWNRIVGLTKFAHICKERSRFRSIEVLYLEACFSRFLK